VRFVRFRLRDDDVVPALLLVVLGALALLTPAQNDTWWHLASGRAMWESGAPIAHEQFSHTSEGSPLANHWWLTQLLFFAIYSSAGAVGLTLIAGGCAVAAVLLSWRLVRGPLELRVPLLLFLIAATAPAWSIRPQVVSLLLLALTLHTVIRDRLTLLIPLFVIWGNAHALVVLGLAVAGSAVLEAMVWSRHRLLRDAVVVAVCAAAPMLSPIGFDYWPQVLRTVSYSKVLELDEYRPAFHAASLPFWLGVGLLAAGAAANWRRLPLMPRSDRILLIASTVLAVAAATAWRNVAFFALAAAPAFSRLMSFPEAARRLRTAPFGAVALVVVAVVLAGGFVTARWRDGGAALGWRPMPPSIAAAVRTCPGPLFNHLEDGGYLIWAVPERAVFVDSRMEAYPLPLLQRSRAADLTGEYAELFADYDIRCAVVRRDSPIGTQLQHDTNFSAVATAGSHQVFTAHRAPAVAGRAGQERRSE
jgi:hypothetical protein